MKRLSKGFTLAEVLITLGIIGVIASLTLPNLSININKQQVGPALSKAVNTLETANALALQEGGARTLDQLTPQDKACYFDVALAKHVQWHKEPLDKPYYKFNNVTAFDFGASNMYVAKDGITYLRKDGDTPVAVADLTVLPLMYSGQYYTVYVDVNGNRKGPNALGRDLFELIIDTKGSVIPVGSETYLNYIKGSTLSWKTNCYSSKIVPTDERACAGAVMDNGYKVIHY